MGTLLEGAKALNEMREEFINRTALLEKDAIYNAENQEDRIERLREASKVRRDKYVKYKSDVKEKLLYEAMHKIVMKSIKAPTINESTMLTSLLNSYIKENGVDNLLSEFHHKTYLLSEVNRLVTKYYNAITEDAEQDDPATQVIDPAKMDDYYKELDTMEDMDDVTNAIRIRVANAEEEFITNNLTDKNNTENIIRDTNQRIESIKQEDNYASADENPNAPKISAATTGNDEDEGNDNMQGDNLATEAVLKSKRELGAIKYDRAHTVFEQMVRKLSESAMKKHEFHDKFLNENGMLEMDNVVEAVRCMYTMLEMVNTLQIENVDADYIENTIKSI